MLPTTYRDTNICIVGLGYVGLTLAVALADVGFSVIGVETAPEVLKHLRMGQPHFSEIGLTAKLERQISSGRLRVAASIDAAAGATVYIVTVGTPIDHAHRTKLDSIQAAVGGVARVLRAGDLVVLRSTVRVGVTRSVAKPLLDQAGVPYQLAYCPERTLEGRALEELRTLPQVVGGIDDASALRAAQMFGFLTPTIVRVSTPETAEVIKLVNNTHRDLSFAFANEIAGVSDALGISVVEVVRGSGLGYPRGQIPMPGPVGGPCLEKDPHILAESVEAYPIDLPLTKGARAVNEGLPSHTVADIGRLRFATSGPAGEVATISVLGLAFKGRPETSDLRGSLSIPLIAAIRAQFPKAVLRGYDPVVPAVDIERLGLALVTTLEDAFERADIVIIQNNHSLFGTMPIEALSERMAHRGIIYDFWNQHDPERLAVREDVTYAGLGTLLGRDRVPRAADVSA